MIAAARRRWSGQGGLIGRAGWGVIDQGFVSLANFGLGVMVARLVSPTDFGAFGIAFAVYLVALNVARGFASQPLAIRFGTRDAEEFRRGTAESTGTALGLGLLGGVGCLAAGLVLDGPLGASLLALGLALPGLLLQDTWRFVLFTARRGRTAMINDFVWAIVLLSLLAVVGALGIGSIFVITLCWGIGAAAAALVGILQTRIIPRVGRALAWRREHADITPRFLLAELAQMAGSQLVLFGIGLILGLAAVGSVRGSQLLLGPFNVLAVGVFLAIVPEAARLAANPTRFGRLAISVTALLTTLGMLWGVAVLLLPEQVGVAILGETWPGARAVLLPVVLAAIAPLAGAGAQIGLFALEESARALRASLVQAIAVVTFGVAGALWWGVNGAAWGMAAAMAAASLVWWLELIRARARRRQSLQVAGSA